MAVYSTPDEGKVEVARDHVAIYDNCHDDEIVRWDAEELEDPKAALNMADNVALALTGGAIVVKDYINPFT